MSASIQESGAAHATGKDSATMVQMNRDQDLKQDKNKAKNERQGGETHQGSFEEGLRIKERGDAQPAENKLLRANNEMGGNRKNKNKNKNKKNKNKNQQPQQQQGGTGQFPSDVQGPVEGGKDNKNKQKDRTEKKDNKNKQSAQQEQGGPSQLPGEKQLGSSFEGGKDNKNKQQQKGGPSQLPGERPVGPSFEADNLNKQKDSKDKQQQGESRQLPSEKKQGAFEGEKDNKDKQRDLPEGKDNKDKPEQREEGDKKEGEDADKPADSHDQTQMGTFEGWGTIFTDLWDRIKTDTGNVGQLLSDTTTRVVDLFQSKKDSAEDWGDDVKEKASQNLQATRKKISELKESSTDKTHEYWNEIEGKMSEMEDKTLNTVDNWIKTRQGKKDEGKKDEGKKDQGMKEGVEKKDENISK